MTNKSRHYWVRSAGSFPKKYNLSNELLPDPRARTPGRSSTLICLLCISVHTCEKHKYFCLAGQTAYGFSALLELQRGAWSHCWPPLQQQRSGRLNLWAHRITVRFTEPSQVALSHSVNQLKGRNHQGKESIKDYKNTKAENHSERMSQWRKKAKAKEEISKRMYCRSRESQKEKRGWAEGNVRARERRKW